MFSYIIILTCIWWVVFFMILPFGAEVSRKPKLGHADSAPTKPRLGIKIIITSAIAIPLTMLIHYAITYGYLASLVDSYIRLLESYNSKY